MTESKEICSIVIDGLLLSEHEQNNDYASIRECLGDGAPYYQCKKMLDRVVNSACMKTPSGSTSFFEWFNESGYYEDVLDTVYEAIDEYILITTEKIIDNERKVS